MSNNGLYHVWMQGDGNVVVYKGNGGGAIWASNTGGVGTGPYKLRLQGEDNNLVVHDKDSQATWSSSTAMHHDTKNTSYLVIQDDGNLVVYREYGIPVWHTGTNGGHTSKKWGTGYLLIGKILSCLYIYFMTKSSRITLL